MRHIPFLLPERSTSESGPSVVFLLAISALLLTLPACASSSSTSSKTRARTESVAHTLVLVDAKTGKIDSYLPDPDSQGPSSVVSDGESGWYVSGRFAHVGKIPRRGLAHLKSDGSVDTAFVPDVPRGVSLGTMLLHGGVLYTTDYGEGVFALDAKSGKSLWHTSDRGNHVMSVAFGNGVLFVGGDFARIGGAARDGIAALDPATGKPTSWQVHLSVSVAGSPAVVALAIVDGTVYIGGAFDRVNNFKRELGLAAVSARTGRPTSWAPRNVGVARRLESAGSLLVTHGQVLVGSAGEGFAAFDARSARALSWSGLLNGSVWALVSSGDTVYLGGTPGPGFSRAGGRPANNLASVVLPQGRFTDWRPDLGPCRDVQAMATYGGKVLVAGYFSSTPCS